MKVFSFSLFGDNPIYKLGLLKNIDFISKNFPEWKVFVYLPIDYDGEYVKNLKELYNNVLVFEMVDEQYYNCTWRFQAISETFVDVMVCRDADSRVSERDIAAINEWLNSNYDYNIIRDHPIGHSWRMNAGMWGAKKNNFILNIKTLLEEFKKNNSHLLGNNTLDQIFLGDVIYPNIHTNTLVHDEYYKYETQAKPIEHDRKSNDFAFIGESVDEFDVPRGDQRSPIIRIYNSKR